MELLRAVNLIIKEFQSNPVKEGLYSYFVQTENVFVIVGQGAFNQLKQEIDSVTTLYAKEFLEIKAIRSILDLTAIACRTHTENLEYIGKIKGVQYSLDVTLPPEQIKIYTYVKGFQSRLNKTILVGEEIQIEN